MSYDYDGGYGAVLGEEGGAVLGEEGGAVLGEEGGAKKKNVFKNLVVDVLKKTDKKNSISWK